MMRIAEFSKISKEQFIKDFEPLVQALIKADPNVPCDEFYDKDEERAYIDAAYDAVTIPSRATTQSAGYDISSPVGFVLRAGETIKIPTGLRCSIEDGWVLMIYPRSSLGFKYRLQLDNTTGIVDSDYYHADNEGHIFLKITNDSRSSKNLTVSVGDRLAQGVFLPYGITHSDYVTASRKGGLGSTGS